MTTAVRLADGQSLASESLRPIYGRQANFTADCLIAAVIKRPRSWLYSHPEYPLTPAERKKLAVWLSRATAGEPLALILGTADFAGLSLLVSRHTLIPRPETERLVELVTANKTATRVADIGTGSGAIAIALAAARPDLTIWATDRSAAALRVARANAKRCRVNRRLTFAHGDLLNPVMDKSCDTIVANLPYVTTADYHANPRLRYEPRSALVSGTDGLNHYRRLLRQISRLVTPPDWIYLEIGLGQVTALRQLFNQTLPAYHFNVERDLARRPRFIVARRQPVSQSE